MGGTEIQQDDREGTGQEDLFKGVALEQELE
jgi:hypothetical protein